MKKRLLLCTAFLMLATLANAQWITQATGFSTPQRGLENISIVDANIVWASAYDGLSTTTAVQEFTRTIDGGLTWTPGTINGASGLNTSNLYALNRDTAWVSMYNGISSGGKIFRTNDGGLTWTHQTTATFAAPAGFPNVVYFFDENNGVALGDPNGGYFEFYTTTDGGDLWTRVAQANIPAFLASNEYGITNRYSVIGNTIWYGTNMGRVYKSTDLGYNWTVATTGLTNISRIVFKDANNGLFTFGSSINRTSDGGASWSPVTYTGTLHNVDLAYAGGTNPMYVSTGGLGSSYSLDDAATWIPVDNVQHTSVAFYDDVTGWTGGFNTTSTTDGIFKWDLLTVGLNTKQIEEKTTIYPNPGNGLFYVSLTGRQSKQTTVAVYDLMGRILLSSTADDAKLSVLSIDITSYPAGVYFVEVKDQTKTITKKIVKH